VLSDGGFADASRVSAMMAATSSAPGQRDLLPGGGEKAAARVHSGQSDMVVSDAAGNSGPADGESGDDVGQSFMVRE
jgi:hypothetical protein